MGMYDNIRCKHPLPGTPPAFAARCLWQTKDLDCDLSTYEITEDGRLLLVETLFGDFLPEPVEVSDVHQDLRFYNSNLRAQDADGTKYTDDGSDYESVDYRARFSNGKLDYIVEEGRERIPARPYSEWPYRPKPKEAQTIAATEVGALPAIQIFDDDGAID